MLTKPEAIKKIAKSLAHFLKERNVSKEELAKLSGVQQEIINDLLAGNTSPAISDWYILFQLSKQLECLVDELIEGPPRTFPVIRSQADLDRFWRRLNGSKYNIYVPRYCDFGPMIKLIPHFIKFDPSMYPQKDGRDSTSGPNFWIKARRYILNYRSLVLISHAAGINWSRSRISMAKYDKQNMPLIIRYEAFGECLDSQGSIIGEPGTYEWNNAVDIENLNDEDRVLERQQFAVGHAEAGAMARALRKLLNLPTSFKQDEVDKTFIIPRYTWDLDANDPVIKERLLQRAFSAEGSLFGRNNGSASASDTSSAIFEDTPRSTGIINPTVTGDAISRPPVTQTNETAGHKGLPTREEYRKKWDAATAEERGKQILELCALGGGASKDFATPEMLSKGKQMYHILDMGAKTNPPQFKIEKRGGHA